MSRKLTTYSRASMTDQMEQAPTIERLAQLRGAVALGYQSGKLDIDTRRLEKMEQAMWNAVLRLLFTAPTGGQLTYVYNYVLRWEKSPAISALVDKAFCLRAMALPSPTQQLAFAGIKIEGVTT